jgi:L-ascorbate metabolism protein UlaG (beta-lactamase superfamily)
VRRKTFVLWIIVAVVISFVDWVVPDVSAPESPGAVHHVRAGFRNVDPEYRYPLLVRARHILRAPAPPRGEPLFVAENDGEALRTRTLAATLTWVGHSTFLVQIDGVNVLTDPHWGQRTSPVTFAGPRRLVPPGIRFTDLPRIDAVVISHDHYDHLDAGTVDRLWRAYHPRFFVPLGIKAWLEARGIDSVTELDWWDSATYRGLTFTCTPAQHSSGRGLTDQNRRLWSSWVLAGESKRMFFAGDTGYYPGLAEIGRRLGPFGVAALPIGGYSDYRTRHPNHLNPEEAAQVFEEIGASLMVPMHWGTFDLNREPFREPPDRLLAAAVQRGIEERVALPSPGETVRW